MYRGIGLEKWDKHYSEICALIIFFAFLQFLSSSLFTFINFPFYKNDYISLYQPGMIVVDPRKPDTKNTFTQNGLKATSKPPLGSAVKVDKRTSPRETFLMSVVLCGQALCRTFIISREHLKVPVPHGILYLSVKSFFRSVSSGGCNPSQ